MARQTGGSKNPPLTDADSRAVRQFLDAIRAEQGASANTLAAYRRDLEATAAELARAAPHATLLTADSAAFRTCLARWGETLKARSVARRLTALGRFMLFCVEEGMRDDDPIAPLDRPKTPQSLPKSLTENAIAAMFAAAIEDAENATDSADACRLVAMLEMLYATGMRISELVSLRIGAVRRKNRAITITGKGGRERVVMMTDAAHAAVAAWIAWRDRAPANLTSDYLFPAGESHISRQRVWREIAALARRAGIAHPVSPHMLRHSFATHMLNRGADLRSLQLLLGHANITTTEVYTKTQDSRLAGLVRDTHPLARG